MAGIGFRDIQQAATQASDSAKLRLGRSDGQVKTAKHGFRSRLVRWIGGATKKDMADNKQLLGNLLSGLKQQYGDQIGTQAFLAARPLAYTNDSGQVIGATARNLTARQVKNALAYAEASQSQQFRGSARAQADMFRPGSDNFNRVARQVGIEPNSLSEDQNSYFKLRLREQVIGISQKTGHQPSGSEVAKLAGKLLKHTVNTVGDDAGAVISAHLAARQSVRQALDALEQSGGDPAAALTDFLNSADAIIEDTAMSDRFGADDTHTARANALDGAVSQLSKREAKVRYDRLMAPNGPGRKALLAAYVAADQISSLATPYKGAAAGDVVQSIRTVIGALAIRAGVGVDELNALAQSIENDPMRGPAKNGVPSSALTTAGVTDARSVSHMADQFDAAMASRGQELERRHRANN